MTRQMSFQEAANTVKLSLDICDVISRYVALKKAGRNLTGLCPFHPEKTPSFSVSPSKQMFKCFGCGEGGDALSFLMKKENKTYAQVIEALAEEHGIDIVYEGKSQQLKTELDLMLELHLTALRYYESQLQHAPEVKRYLDERQIPPEWQAHFGLGYAPSGWENLITHLRQQMPAVQSNPGILEKAGLANTRNEGQGYYDRFRHRLMIPIHDDRGRVIAFGARSLDPADQPKYLNSPETALYVKNRVLYGLAQAKEAIRSAEYAILMEGYFDVISAHMAGIPQAVGVCGTSLTDNHLKLLKRFGANTLYLCFDSDNAGKTAALRAIDLIQHHLLEQHLQLKVIHLPDAKDPDDFIKSHGKQAFLNCLETAEDFLHFKFEATLAPIDNLHTPEGRIEAVRLTIPLLAQIQQPVIRHEYLRMLSQRVQIAEETLLLELKRYEQTNTPYANKKNYETEAIFSRAQRYKERKPWDKRKAYRKPEDTTIFRKALSPKLPIEEKEHQLISYLLLNYESYQLVMDTLNSFELQSPLAKSFLQAVKNCHGQWQTIDELVLQLQTLFHSHDNQQQLQFLAHRLLALDEIQDGTASVNKGLKSVVNREKLKRDIADIVNKIHYLRKRDTLSHLAHNGRQHEQQSDDDSALQIQLQLREALYAQRQKQKPAPGNCDQALLEEEQGV